MRKLVVSEFISLDGVIEAPGGESAYRHNGWVANFMGAEALQYKFDELMEASALLIGRLTYDTFAATWPQRESPCSDGVDLMQAFTNRINTMPKYVASNSLREPSWDNTKVLGTDLGNEITELKKQKGGPLLVTGSATLVKHLLALQLVDELRLMIFPVLLGHGRRLFPEVEDKTLLRLAMSVPLDNGIIAQHYLRH